jgi:hypothetical protein
MERNIFKSKVKSQRSKVKGQKLKVKRIYSSSPSAPSALFYGVLTIACWMGLATATLAARGEETQLKVGVVQRFGDELTDELTLQATPGDRLQLTMSN